MKSVESHFAESLFAMRTIGSEKCENVEQWSDLSTDRSVECHVEKLKLNLSRTIGKGMQVGVRHFFDLILSLSPSRTRALSLSRMRKCSPHIFVRF